MGRCYCRCNWATRNNSANIAAVLNPQYCGPFEKKKLLGDNTCYCREKNVPPTLFQRPKRCIVVPSPRKPFSGFVTFRQPPDSYRERSKTDSNVISYFAAKSLDDSSRQSRDVNAYLRNLRESASEEEEQLSFPQFRRISRESEKEIATEERSGRLLNNKSSKQRITEEEIAGEVSWSTRPQETTTEEKIARVVSSSVRPQEISTEEKKSTPDIKELSDFRKDHYFETHSTDDLFRTVPEHTCIHRFNLDDRFLPEALNKDAYGSSRCIICGKIMENQPVSKEDERIRNVFPKFYKYGLAPKKIYMGNDGNVQIEIVGERAKGCDWKKERETRPNYFNTYALRYQKGVK